MKYRFIDDHQQEFPIRLMCRVLEVSTSGYYAWRKRPPSQREMANQQLLKAIEAAFTDNHGIYGSPRIYEEIKGQVLCSKKRVARLMKEAGLRARQTRRYKHTTKANPAHLTAPNLLDQDFEAIAPNQKWTTDITYIPTLEGWLYLAVVLDLFSRRVVGWAMEARMTSDLVLSALQMAIQRRRPAAGLLHHSDRGSQYTGQPYQTLLKNHLFAVSMSGRGNCYDNAPTESFFGKLKMEWIQQTLYENRDHARTDIFFYIEAFYNRKRRHSSLGYLSPDAYEASFNQQQSALTACL